MLLRSYEIQNLIRGAGVPQFLKYNTIPEISSKVSKRIATPNRNIIRLGGQLFRKIEIETRIQDDLLVSPKREFKIPQLNMKKYDFLEDKNSMIVKISDNVLGSRKPQQEFTLLFYEDIEREVEERHRLCLTQGKIKRNNSGVAESLKDLQARLGAKNAVKTSSSFFNTGLPLSKPRRPFEFPKRLLDRSTSPARRFYDTRLQKPH